MWMVRATCVSAASRDQPIPYRAETGYDVSTKRTDTSENSIDRHKYDLEQNGFCQKCLRREQNCECTPEEDQERWVDLQRRLNEEDQELYGYRHGNKSLIKQVKLF